MSSKDRFEKTFSRKKKETTTAATTTTNNNSNNEKKSNNEKTKTGEKQLLTTQPKPKPKPKSQPPKQKHPPLTPSSKNQTKITASKPIKITFKCQEKQQPTNNISPSSSSMPKKKNASAKPEQDEILNKEKKKKKKKKKRKAEDESVGEDKGDDEKVKVQIGKKEMKEKDKLDDDEGLECAFPTARITRIVKSEGFDSKITAEAVFLINKATEKFIELFSEDAYGYAAEERKSFVGYKHLSSVVSKGKMFDFLSDFVPEKVAAEKALAERNPPVTLPG